MTPASVSSLDTSSQQPPSNTSAANLDSKMDVKQQDEEEESDTGSCSKGGKLSSLKTEEKPVKLELKKEDCAGEGGKVVPMETSTAAAAPTAGIKTEDRKPEVKKEVKDEEETSETAAPQAPSKKKSEENFYSFVSLNVAESQSEEVKASQHVCLLNSFTLFLPPLYFFLLSVFKPEELRQALMPTLESLYRQDPESLPFRMPVDPQLLCIPVCI